MSEKPVAPKMSNAEMMRRFAPRQFTKATKLCARCGNRVQWDDEKRCLVCRRCKSEY